VKTALQSVPPAYLERYPEAGGPAERVPLWKVPFTIGRSETADHTVYSSKVSKEHAAIEVAGQRYVVRDLDSTNGTFVNEERVRQQATLKNGDTLRIGRVELSVERIVIN
jgi:pSer/pThr/pTyr-binding forkhead associated (FHA) protein